MTTSLRVFYRAVAAALCCNTTTFQSVKLEVEFVFGADFNISSPVWDVQGQDGSWGTACWGDCLVCESKKLIFACCRCCGSDPSHDSLSATELSVVEFEPLRMRASSSKCEATVIDWKTNRSTRGRRSNGRTENRWTDGLGPKLKKCRHHCCLLG